MKKNRSVLLLLVLAVMISVSACNSREKTVEEEKTFAPDVVFTVNGDEVLLGEWNLYARPVIEDIDSFYGSEIWKYEMDAEGKLFGEALQEDIRNRIVNVKMVASYAVSLGVELSEDDRTEIKISSEEYFSKLSENDREKYKITEELVEKVCQDNFLANKVYEYITLNVDTKTDDSEVRHMVLRYIMLPKTYEDSDGNTVYYSDEELMLKRSRLQDIRDTVSEGNKTLKDYESDSFAVNEIITDLAGLKEKLPEDKAEKVFKLKQQKLSQVYETDEAFFLFECIDENDEESTKAARIRIIEQREQQVFEESYLSWKESIKVETNEKVWKSIAESDFDTLNNQ